MRRNLRVGVTSTGISLLMAVAMVANSPHSDQMMEPRWHLMLPPVVGALEFFFTASTPPTQLAVGRLAIIVVGAGAAFGPCLTILTRHVSIRK